MSEIIVTPGGMVLIGGRLCLDFCNTVTERFDEQPIDSLTRRGYPGLIRWSRALNLLDDNQAAHLGALADSQPDQAAAVLESAMDLRESLYQVFVSRIGQNMVSQDTLAAALNTLNQHWHQAMEHRELRVSGNGEFTWCWRESGTPKALLWQIALDGSEVLTQDDPTRIRQCPGCGWLFYDHSRNNSRTWCDMRFCGNRAKNKRFHDRQRSED
jgi:predicted RNA-binding Zn ribbon-like protein